MYCSTSGENRWRRWGESKGGLCSPQPPVCHLAKDTEVSTAVPPDYRPPPFPGALSLSFHTRLREIVLFFVLTLRSSVNWIFAPHSKMVCKLTDTLTLNSGRCHTWAWAARLVYARRRNNPLQCRRCCNNSAWIVMSPNVPGVSGTSALLYSTETDVAAENSHNPSVCPCEACCCCYNSGDEESQQHSAPSPLPRCCLRGSARCDDH